ncbi:MAG: SUMF1/EgtB/PvdO family nonheme iron enzyme [Magnetococcales bacterium]|nr:SUMF1/EgtB/PvdO family nonheme iron enzyme [Magnetococcales bacterium]
MQRWWCAAGWTGRLKANWENPYNWDAQTLYPNHPVTGVSWFETMAYCRWLSELEKRMIRLPVETLWAKAATPSKGAYPWGEAEVTRTGVGRGHESAARNGGILMRRATAKGGNPVERVGS